MTLTQLELTLSKKEQILNLLRQKPMTVAELEDILKIKKDLIWVYISLWKKEGKIEDTGEIRKKYKVYKIKEQKIPPNIDTVILRKMIPKFVELGVNDIKFENEEIERIKELYLESKK